MNSRAKMLIGALLSILLVCAALIFLDQKGAFGGGNSGGTRPTINTPSGGAAPTPTPQPSSGGGFGDLK